MAEKADPRGDNIQPEREIVSRWIEDRAAERDVCCPRVDRLSQPES